MGLISLFKRRRVIQKSEKEVGKEGREIRKRDQLRELNNEKPQEEKAREKEKRSLHS